MQKLNYCNEDIYVFFARDKEAPKSFLEASDTSFEPDRRVSKRSRKTNNGDLINLKVSGSTSIYQLKMMIWESFGVCYIQQKHRFFFPCVILFNWIYMKWLSYLFLQNILCADKHLITDSIDYAGCQGKSDTSKRCQDNWQGICYSCRHEYISWR